MARPVRPRRRKHVHARPAWDAFAPPGQPVGELGAGGVEPGGVLAGDIGPDQRRCGLAERAGADLLPEAGDAAIGIEIEIDRHLAAADRRDTGGGALRRDEPCRAGGRGGEPQDPGVVERFGHRFDIGAGGRRGEGPPLAVSVRPS